MAGENSLASLVILTDSVRVLQEHVNTGHVFKTANPEQILIRYSSTEEAKLSLDKDVSNNSKSDKCDKLPLDDCVSGNFESDELSDDIIKSQMLFSSIESDSEMKLRRFSDESNSSSDDFNNEHVLFKNEQETACFEKSFASFRSNKTMSLKTYSKRQSDINDKQFDRLKLLSDAENLTDLSHLHERESCVTKDNSYMCQISYLEDKLCPPIKKSKRSQRTKLAKKTAEKENSKALAKIAEGTTTSSKDLVDKLESECKISTSSRFQAQERIKISKTKRISRSNKVKGRQELYKCLACGKAMKKTISTSKYVFRNSSIAKSRKCQKCRINKIGSSKNFSQK